MNALSWVVLGLAWLAPAAVILSKVLSLRRAKKQNLPPGPKPWPIIGNLNLMGHLPHRSLHDLSQKHGPIMQLRFGSFPVVVASSPEMAKQFLKTNDHLFASRPPTAAGKYITYNANITWTPYGPHWRHGRKIFLTELFSPKRLDFYEHIRAEERRAFISGLSASSGEPVTLKDHLCRLTLSVISRIVLGEKFFSSESPVVGFKEFQEMMDEVFVLSGAMNIGDWIPWMEFLDLQGYVKRMKTLHQKLDRFLDDVVEKHRAKGERDDSGGKDMVDSLLSLADDPDLEVKLAIDGVKAFTLEFEELKYMIEHYRSNMCPYLEKDLIAGGTDTAATTLEWAMSELLRNPRVAEKAAEELERVVGKDRWAEERDIPQLPYISAITKETMRLHPVVALLVPHLALEDCNVAGYDIRRGTRVLVNTWSMGRDPELWEAPERFLEGGEASGVDVRGQSFELLPFGSGRRMCPGYSLGLKVVLSNLANMLHGFKWKLAGGVKAEELNMDDVFGLTNQRKFPLVAVVEPRLPPHLY